MPEARSDPPRRPVGAPPGRRAHGRAREQSILDAAADLFSETGLDATTRELAARLGITQPLLYRYFESKERLVERVLDHAVPFDWGAQWATLPADPSLPLRERLASFFLAYSDQVLTCRRVRLLMYSGLKRVGMAAEVLQGFRARAVDHVLVELGVDGVRVAEAMPHHRERSLACGLHDGVFALAVRRHVLDVAGAADLGGAIEAQVDHFLQIVLPVAWPGSAHRPAAPASAGLGAAEPGGSTAALPVGLVAESLATGGTVWASPAPEKAAGALSCGEPGTRLREKNEGTPLRARE